MNAEKENESNQYITSSKLVEGDIAPAERVKIPLPYMPNLRVTRSSPEDKHFEKESWLFRLKRLLSFSKGTL